MDKNKEAVLLHALMNKNQQYTKRRKKESGTFIKSYEL